MWVVKDNIPVQPKIKIMRGPTHGGARVSFDLEIYRRLLAAIALDLIFNVCPSLSETQIGAFDCADLYEHIFGATTLRLTESRPLQVGLVHAPCLRRHAIEFRDRVESVDPGLLRANKYLAAWQQFISLANRSKPHVVGFWLIASRRGIDRRPAARAKSLHTDVSTIGGLSIFRRLTGQKHELSWTSDNDRSQWSAAHDLAVCAVANSRRFGIGFGLERHVAAVTASINFHDRFPRPANRDG
jgi:hypothetical protein